MTCFVSGSISHDRFVSAGEQIFQGNLYDSVSNRKEVLIAQEKRPDSPSAQNMTQDDQINSVRDAKIRVSNVTLYSLNALSVLSKVLDRFLEHSPRPSTSRQDFCVAFLYYCARSTSKLKNALGLDFITLQ